MKNKISLKVPLFINDPVAGRSIYPPEMRWHITLFIVIVVLLPNGYLLIYKDAIYPDYPIYSLLFSIFLIISTFLYNHLLNRIFIDKIEVRKNVLKYKYSKFSKKQELTYRKDSITKFIVYEEKYGNRKILYLLDSSGKEHLFIDKFRLGTWEKSWKNFLSLLSESTEIPIEVIRIKEIN